MDKKLVLEKLHQKMIAEIKDYAIILLDLDGTILSCSILFPGTSRPVAVMASSR